MAAAEPRTDLNAGELDCLAVIWQAGRPMKLSDVHRALNLRRHEIGETPAALSTVSTWLRALALKGLLLEKVLGGTEDEAQAVVRTRGMIPATRSPKTAYEAAYQPGAVLRKTFKALADAYPRDQRKQALVDFARALDLPDKILKKLQKLIEEG